MAKFPKPKRSDLVWRSDLMISQYIKAVNEKKSACDCNVLHYNQTYLGKHGIYIYTSSFQDILYKHLGFLLPDHLLLSTITFDSGYSSTAQIAQPRGIKTRFAWIFWLLQDSCYMEPIRTDWLNTLLHW